MIAPLFFPLPFLVHALDVEEIGLAAAAVAVHGGSAGSAGIGGRVLALLGPRRQLRHRLRRLLLLRLLLLQQLLLLLVFVECSLFLLQDEILW